LANEPGLDEYLGNGQWARRMVLTGSNVADYGPVVPNDAADLAKQAIGFMVTGTVGSVTVHTPAGTEVTFPAAIIALGEIINLPVKRIKATGTTATGIWAVYPL
jgi:hypothetical protein